MITLTINNVIIIYFITALLLFNKSKNAKKKCAFTVSVQSIGKKRLTRLDPFPWVKYAGLPNYGDSEKVAYSYRQNVAELSERF